MKIIARRFGESYLIEVDEKTHWVFDEEENEVLKGLPLQDILGWRYWIDGGGGLFEERILEAMRKAEVVERKPRPSPSAQSLRLDERRQERGG